jgi:GH24 family phage-related lysozyme (muramidase)
MATTQSDTPPAQYAPMFLQNHPLSDWTPKNYVPPAFFENNVNERIRNLVHPSHFRKVTAVGQAAKVGIPFETYSAEPYEDRGYQSIGYGTRRIGDEKSIPEPEARRRMFVDLDKKHQELMKHKAYAAANPNTQGGLLDTFYTIGTALDVHSPMVKEMMKDPKNLPYIIQEIPTYRKARNEKTKQKEVVEGLERRRADDFRLAIDPNDTEYLPVFIR